MSQLNLVVSIVNRGYADDAMAAAKKAGATGGTILTGRGTIKEEMAKFFGIALHAEKELLLIVTSQEKKAAIMQAIINQANDNEDEEHKGLVFSLPVEKALGFSKLTVPEEFNKE